MSDHTIVARSMLTVVEAFQRRVADGRAAGRVELHVDLDTAELLGKLAKVAADAYARKDSAP